MPIALQTLCATKFLRGNFSARIPSNNRTPLNGSTALDAPETVALHDKLGSIVDNGKLQLWRLWSQTDWRLDSMHRRALEGKQAEEAQAFASYVVSAGLADLIDSVEWDADLKADGAGLLRKAERLQEVCRAQFHKGNFKPSVEMSELEKFNHQLDLIAAQVARQDGR